MRRSMSNFLKDDMSFPYEYSGVLFQSDRPRKKGDFKPFGSEERYGAAEIPCMGPERKVWRVVAVMAILICRKPIVCRESTNTTHSPPARPLLLHHRAHKI